jgi:uncharacterized integral membrane protein (TIGR00698 family)
MADPLLIALVCGIIIRTFFPISTELKKGVLLAPKIFIPVGIVFYAAKNLNFVKFAQIDIKMIVLISAVITVYFTSILLLGKILKQKPQITYLSATGSAICGASAITITSQAVKADSDDISISLLAVAFSSFFALFIMLPFLATLLGMTNYTYGLFSGSVLQITGFVKEAAGNVPFLSETVAPAGLVKQALSIKALRYLGLLAAIPFLASLCKNKWNLPWSLWLFLTAGICGSIIFALNESFYNETIMPFIKPAYLILWSTAMAAVGLNADLRLLLSDNGAKALVMTFTGFIFACITFLVGINIIAFF